MVLNKQVSKKNFYKEYYTALNGVLKLSRLELEILAKLSFLKYSGEEILSKTTRKDIALDLNITTFNLNNYIGILKDKRMLVDLGGNFDINPQIYKPLNESEFKIEFNFYVQ